MKNLFLHSILLFLSAGVHAQWKEMPLSEFSDMILAYEARIPEGSSYSYQAVYRLYEQLDAKEPQAVLDFELIYKNKSKELFINQFGRITVQDAQTQVVCDTASRMVIVQPALKELTQRKTLDDFKPFLNSQCKAFKNTVNGETGYYLEFAKGATYKGAELWMSDKGELRKYILYAGKQTLDDSSPEEKMIQPRMEITFTRFIIGDKSEKLPAKKISDYVVSLKPLEVKPEYKEFELVDLRNNQ